MYTLQEDKKIEGYKSKITAYKGKIVRDAVFLNPVPNKKYWFTPTNKGFSDVTVRLK